MGVLPITEVMQLCKCDRHVGRRKGIAVAQILGDRCVVHRHVLECLVCELLALAWGERSACQPLADPSVVRRVHDHHYVWEVLRRRPDHGGPADIDVLQGIVETRPAAHGLDERVQVACHQIDGVDAVLLELGRVIGGVTTSQKATIHLGVQGLDSPVQYLRESGQVGHLRYGQPSL